MKSLILSLIRLFGISHQSHHGVLRVKRSCVLVHSVYDETGRLVFSSNDPDAADEFVAWYNIQCAEVKRKSTAPDGICISDGCKHSVHSVSESTPSKKQWACPCGYFNIGPICTKCGTVPSAPDPTPSENRMLDPWGGGPVTDSEQPDLPHDEFDARLKRLWDVAHRSKEKS